jgi:hypothetical protein
MPYSQFTNISKLKEVFGLKTQEGGRFLKLEDNTVTIDFMDYPLPPVEQILGFLVWMLQNG